MLFVFLFIYCNSHNTQKKNVSKRFAINKIELHTECRCFGIKQIILFGVSLWNVKIYDDFVIFFVSLLQFRNLCSRVYVFYGRRFYECVKWMSSCQIVCVSVSLCVCIAVSLSPSVSTHPSIHKTMHSCACVHVCVCWFPFIRSLYLHNVCNRMPIWISRHTISVFSYKVMCQFDSISFQRIRKG